MITPYILKTNGVSEQSSQRLQEAFTQRPSHFNQPIVVDEKTLQQHLAKIDSAEAPKHLVVVPGGYAPMISVSLNMNTKTGKLAWLQNFVKEGGGYLGICAGAIIGSSKLNHSVPRFMQAPLITTYPGLGLLPVQANSPAFNKLSPVSLTENFDDALKSSIKVRVHCEDQNMRIAYNCHGPEFPSNSCKDVNVLATYEKNGKLSTAGAVVQGSYGKGNVVLSTIHTELTAEDVGNTETEAESTSRSELTDLLLASFMPEANEELNLQAVDSNVLEK